MHEICAEVEEVTATPEPTEDEPDPEPVTEYILHITISSKSVDALADLYRFTQDQRDILHQLLSEEMRPSLLALCGGTAVADGTLCWPLPGHTYISCHFGEVDAFGNAGHRGTDIPAPEGTPILAAHSGTVLVSGWNDSYGNQVLLDNGAGLSTRYAYWVVIIGMYPKARTVCILKYPIDGPIHFLRFCFSRHDFFRRNRMVIVRSAHIALNSA